MTDTSPCPCCSGKKYEECCGVYHKGVLPENARKLMRSRYSAYALDIPEYIMATTHPKGEHWCEDAIAWRMSISEFSRVSSFHRLEVCDFSEKDKTATVTFTAYITQHGQDVTFTEKSYFEEIEGKWLYHSGEMLPKKKH
jgi:SEC-C motif domain protein